jgi:hypothetical protein
MDINELIARLIILKGELESDGRDLSTVAVYAHGRLVQTAELLDDGSQQDNLDVHLSS